MSAFVNKLAIMHTETVFDCGLLFCQIDCDQACAALLVDRAKKTELTLVIVLARHGMSLQM